METLNPAIIASDLRHMGLNASTGTDTIEIREITSNKIVGIYPVADYEGDSEGERGAAMRIAWKHFQKPTGVK